MRPSCLDCCRKHLSAALVLSLEVLQGYPIHSWIVIGHLNEASDEVIKDYPELADKIREERLNYMQSINKSLRIDENDELYLSESLYEIDFLQIIKDVTAQHIFEITNIEDQTEN